MKYILAAQQVYFLGESSGEKREQDGALIIQALMDHSSTARLQMLRPQADQKRASQFTEGASSTLEFFLPIPPRPGSPLRQARSRKLSCFQADRKEAHRSTLSEGCHLLNYRHRILQKRPPHQLSTGYGVSTIQNSTTGLVLFLMVPIKGSRTTCLEASP